MAAMKRGSEGFALVEAVVSLAIVAVILGVAFQTMTFALRTIRGAEQRRAAMLTARSLVAQLGASVPLVPGSSEGQQGLLRWRIDIASVSDREIQIPLRHAVVTVGDDHAKVLARLETLRLAR